MQLRKRKKIEKANRCCCEDDGEDEGAMKKLVVGDRGTNESAFGIIEIKHF